jgi:SAM-dependent methyltransferase
VQYESVTFEDVHRDVLHLIPTRPSCVLDIGAGTGRDAAALAARGHKVTAAEPTAELRAHGQRLHHAATIDWVDDTLPDLTHLRAAPTRFDLIMLTAVWMHLEKRERERAMPAVASLLAPGGQAIMTLRHGPVPDGRRMFDVGADETIALAQANGLIPVFTGSRGDWLCRATVRWTLLAFRKEQG